MFQDLSLKEFSDQLASGAPTPGGGSAAAVAAVMAASLVQMVANLTKGKKGYEDFEALMEETICKMSEKRQKLLQQINKDAKAFEEVMTALQMPKQTAEEKTSRKTALQKALVNATEVPLDTSRKAMQLALSALDMAKWGNKNAVSDAFSALELSRASFFMSLENVEINLGMIKDTVYTEQVKEEITELRTQLEGVIQQAVELKNS